MADQQKNDSKKDEFSRLAEEQSPGFLMEFWDFLTNNKKWWLTPVIIILLLAGGLVIVAGTGYAFIYTLF